jgi:hypothetical protein
MTLWSPDHPFECQMSKRKTAKASRHAASPKIAAKAQRANQAIVRSPKQRHRSVAVGSTQSPTKLQKDPNQEAPLIENPATAFQDDHKPAVRVGFDLSSATANVRAYQAMLQRTAQANMQFAFEFFQRLATIKSPFEIPSVIAELTSKQMTMFRNIVFSSQSAPQ